MKGFLKALSVIIAISLQAFNTHRDDEDYYFIHNQANSDFLVQKFVKEKQISNILVKAGEKRNEGGGGHFTIDSVIFQQVNNPAKFVKYKPYAYDTAAYNQHKDRNFFNYDNWKRESKSNHHYIYTVLEEHF